MLILETFAHVVKNVAPIGSGLSGGEMDEAVDAGRLRTPIEGQGMPAAVDDRQGLLGLP
jgi:hypothetical protein